MVNEKARQLRRNSTDAERRLWKILRGRHFNGYKFRRQHPVGNYIADFACIEKQLIVEADGSQHTESSYDQKRTAWLQEQGWHVVRFWNHDIVANSEGILEMILQELRGGEAVPSPSQTLRVWGPPSPAMRERAGS